VNAVEQDKRGYLLVAVAAASWGTWPLLLKWAESHGPLSPRVESIVLFVVTALVTGPLVLRDRIAKRATLWQWMGVAWLGVGDAANVVLFFQAYQVTNVAVAVLTHYLAPLFIALAAPVFLKERLTWRSLMAVSVGFIGLFLLLQPWSKSPGENVLKGAALGAGSAAFYASNVLVNKRINHVFSGSEMMFFHAVVAVPFLAFFVPRAEWTGTDPHALLAVSIAAIGPGALGGLFFTWGLKRIPASHASTLTLLEPLVAVMSAAAVLGQNPGSVAIFGGLLVLAGAAAVLSQTHHPK
jgi:drug/metabolite transporter (DMT)-like permease